MSSCGKKFDLGSILAPYHSPNPAISNSQVQRKAVRASGDNGEFQKSFQGYNVPFGLSSS